MRRSGLKREEIFLTTKLWNEDVRQGRAKDAFRESLERLKTDYVDLYLIHWPVQGYKKAWHDMEDLYEEGLIKAIGLSNFHLHHLETLKPSMRVKPAVDQIESNPRFANQELIDELLRLEIAPEVWSPLGGSLDSNILGDGTIAEIGKKHGRTPAQIVLRWHLQRNVIVLSKSVHEDRIRSNLQLFDFELDAGDMLRLNGMNTGQRVGSDPDNFNF